MEALENGISTLEYAHGRFPHVSGMHVTIDIHAPVGQRIVAASVNGQPLDTEKTYTLVTLDFLFQGGDGYGMLKTKALKVDTTQTKQVVDFVLEALSNTKTLAPEKDGRIIIN